MCGIVGAIAQRDVWPILLSGLQRLEYRGYDSAGMAIIDDQPTMQRIRKQGKVSELASALEHSAITGHIGIAHTRWATHGIPAERNAHPILCNKAKLAIVHNGIIENHNDLRKQLLTAGYTFESETDTEIVVHLLQQQLTQTTDLIDAALAVANQLKGAFAIGIAHSDHPNRLIAIRQGCPLVIGLGVTENFFASDQLALLPITQRFVHLQDGDIADIQLQNYTIYTRDGSTVTRDIHTSTALADEATKGDYRHFMEKEIHQQPNALTQLLEARLGNDSVLAQVFGDQADAIFPQVERVQIVACGTSYHAGLVARYWLEAIAGIPCQVEVASEFRYRHTVVQSNTLFVTLSQSGETADTLAALHSVKEAGYLGTLAICNVPESTLVRESDLTLMMRAGIEIGVASTKAFTAQLTGLLMLTAVLARNQHSLPNAQEAHIVQLLRELPQQISKVIRLNDDIKQLAPLFVDKHHALFLGRGIQYPIALEGALKLKEISYIHAEAYPAGELKHGPLALVDEDMPVVAVAPNDALLTKLAANLQEVQTRGGKLIVFADQKAEAAVRSNQDNIITLTIPTVDDVIAPIVYTIPLQLLAYHVAVLKGTDVDQPRNLAKSVTVE